VCTEDLIRVDEERMAKAGAMIGLLCLFFALLVAPFKSKGRLEAESVVALRLNIVLRRPQPVGLQFMKETGSSKPPPVLDQRLTNDTPQPNENKRRQT
jgi:hypothetical protein